MQVVNPKLAELVGRGGGGGGGRYRGGEIWVPTSFPRILVVNNFLMIN